MSLKQYHHTNRGNTLEALAALCASLWNGAWIETTQLSGKDIIDRSTRDVERKSYIKKSSGSVMVPV